jgi:hypothetical protein
MENLNAPSFIFKSKHSVRSAKYFVHSFFNFEFNSVTVSIAYSCCRFNSSHSALSAKFSARSTSIVLCSALFVVDPQSWVVFKN